MFASLLNMFKQLCQVTGSVFIHGAFEITTPLQGFRAPKEILYLLTIFFEKRNHFFTSCASPPFPKSPFNVLFFLEDIIFLLTSLCFNFHNLTFRHRFQCRSECADYVAFFLMTS